MISRVFEKKNSSSGKKAYFSGLVRLNSSFENEIGSSFLPPLMDSSFSKSEKPHVTCFSNGTLMEFGQKNKQENKNDDYFNHSLISTSENPTDISNSSLIFSKISVPNSLYFNQTLPKLGNFQYPSSVSVQDQSILRTLLENHGSSTIKLENCKVVESISQETGLTTDHEISSVVSNHEMGSRSLEEQDAPSTSSGPVDLDYLWNY